MKTNILTNWNKLLSIGIALVLLSLFTSQASAQDQETFDASGYTAANDDVWVDYNVNWYDYGATGYDDEVWFSVNGNADIASYAGNDASGSYLVDVSDRTSAMSVTDDYSDAGDGWGVSYSFSIRAVHNTKQMALSSSSFSFNKVRVGTSITNALSVASTGTLNLTVSSSFNSGPPFSSTPIDANRIIYGNSGENDNVTFAPTTRGMFTDSLIYTSDADYASQKRMAVYVSGQGIQAIFNATNGSSMAFGNLHLGNTTQQTYSFSNTGDDTLYLQAPIISGGGFSVDSSQGSTTLAPGATGSIVVQFTAYLWQPYSGTMTLTALNGVNVPPITLSGVGILPQIQSVSNSVAFGKVRVGKIPSGTITFSNTGNDILHISNVTLPQPFVLQGYDQSVVPGATGTFHFVYAPNGRSIDSAQLSFTTDDPSHPLITVRMNGQGIQAIFNAYEGTTVAFGNVHVGGSGQQEFLFSNTGDDTLFLQTPVIAGSGFKIVVNPANLTVLPYQGISIIMQFTPIAEQSYSGTLSFTASNSVTTPTVFLGGTGALPHMVVAGNRQTVDLGQVKINSRTKHDFAIANNGGADLKITNATVTPLPFSISGVSPTISGNTIGYVTVAFAPTATGGFSGTLIIAGDDATNTSDTIFITGTGINSNLSINPVNVEFGSVPVLNTVIDTITLSNTGSATVKISSYTFTPMTGEFTIAGSPALQVSPGGTAVIVVSFHPNTAGNYSGILTLSTDDASAPIRTVNLSGTGVKGRFAVTTSIDFDTVTVGHNATFRTLVRNIGQASLAINSLSMTGDAFSHGSFATPLMLAPGDSASLDITFTPTAKGSADGSVQFTLDDNTSVNMALHGVGEVVVVAGVHDRDAMEFSLTISPNPATTSATAHIKVDQSSDGEIKIFDATGREMFQIPLGLLESGMHDVSLPIERLVSGGYFIRVTNSIGNVVMTKLLLQR